MKLQLTLIKVSVKDEIELKKIKTILASFYPKIPRYVLVENKRKYLIKATLMVNNLEEIRSYFNVTDKEWRIFKEGIKARKGEAIVLVNSRIIEWERLKKNV